jgi:hypothetical protein
MRSIPFYSAILSLMILQVGKCDDPKDSERVDGTWVGSKAELRGKPFPEELTKTIRITVEKGKYKVAVSERDIRRRNIQAGSVDEAEVLGSNRYGWSEQREAVTGHLRVGRRYPEGLLRSNRQEPPQGV